MNRFRALVMMQLRDKVDLSFAKDVKTLIRKIVLSVLKFAMITATVYLLVLVCDRLLVIFYADEIPSVMVLTLTFFFFLSVISCTAGLVKTMYFADDNKVLVTFPMGENVVFLSKLFVFYIYELIRGFSLLFPLVTGFVISMVTINMLSPIVFLIMWIPMFVYAAIPVTVGALLSVPTQFVVRFFMRYKVIGYTVFLAVLALIVYGIVKLISIMPENINIFSFYQTDLKPGIQSFLRNFESKFILFKQLVSIFIGERTAYGAYYYSWWTLLKFLALFGVVGVLFSLVFVTTKFVFYSIMRKSFEFEKKLGVKGKENAPHRKWFAFVLKELRLNFRSIATVLNFLSVYIVVPLMIFLMNKVFSLVSTSLRGDNLVFAFNILIILLPLLASNAMIAKAFSAEGRAAYIKKTKPVNVLWPLTAKFIVNLIGSMVSVLISVIVFSYFTNISFGYLALLYFGLTFTQCGHTFFSATLDIMNPLNEQIATAGDSQGSKSENISTISAFAIAVLYAFISFILLGEAPINVGGYTLAYVKLFAIGVLVFAAAFYMYFSKIEAFYYDK